MSDEKRKAAAGAARARLASFERQQKGKKSLFVRIGILLGLILACLGALALLNSSLDDEWFDISRDAAWCVTKDNWEGLTALLSDDFRLDAPVQLDRAALVAALRSDKDPSLSVFATRPHEWTSRDEGYDVSFWVVASRGDLSKEETVPLVRTWLVRARLERIGDHWGFTRASAKEALAQPPR